MAGRFRIWFGLRRGFFRGQRNSKTSELAGEARRFVATSAGIGAIGASDLPAEQDCVHRTEFPGPRGRERNGNSERAGDFFQGDLRAGGTKRSTGHTEKCNEKG